jgi:DNA repair exonuclease SbcCD nuclease subunit
LHTSCDGSIGEHATYAPCSLGDLVSKGYQYWALGHIHGYRELHRSPHIVFPGNLQGRGVHECGPKGALFVKVKDDQVETERIIVDRVRWFDVGIDVENCPTPEEVFAQIELQLQDAMSSVEFSAFDRQLVFRIRLQGNTALHNVFIRDRLEIQDDIQATLHHLGEHVWLEQLKIETTDVAAIQANSDHLLDPMDLTSSIEAISATSEFHEHAKAIFAEILRKLPAGTSESQLFPVQEIDDMIAEAGQFLVTRSAAKGAKAS